MIPFGEEANDELLATNCRTNPDKYSQLSFIHLELGFLFTYSQSGASLTNVQVANSGFVSNRLHLRTVFAAYSVPEAFVDCTGLRIWHRSSTQARDRTLVSAQVNRAFNKTREDALFKAKHVFVVTWQNLTSRSLFKVSSCTFQLVFGIDSGNAYSYVVYNYGPCGEGMGQMFVPGSEKQMLSQDGTKTNVGVPGQFAFLLYEKSMKRSTL